MPYGPPSCGISFANMGVGVVRVVFTVDPREGSIEPQ